MTWHCKLCSAYLTSRTHLFKHCRLQHSHFSRVSPLPCLHDDCTFQQPFSESVLLSHVRTHLKNNETVVCPYKDCNYSTNMYSSFSSHKSRVHQASLASDFRNVYECTQNLQATSSDVTSELYEECPGQSTETEDDEQCDTFNLKIQLKLNVASLFLKMQAILYVSNTATQQIVDHLNKISLSQPLIKEAVNDIL